jgi:4-hydroxy-tetrahydrodipicolinate synthase
MLKGAFTALITPFRNGEVDYDAYTELVRFQIKKGINGLVPLGTTGEAPTITEEERVKIIRITVKEAKGKVPVIVGTGSNSTKKTIEETRIAKDMGADYALIVTPYYNKPTQEGIYQHFKAVAEAVDIPIIVYNIQGRTGVNIETPTLKRMAALKNIVGVKEASGNMMQMMEVVRQMPKDFSVLSGDDGMTVPLISIGGTGIISVASNIVPDKVALMVKLASSGEFEKAQKLHYELLDLFNVQFCETNPIPIKFAASLMGMCREEYRLPMCPLASDANREKMKKCLKNLKIIK